MEDFPYARAAVDYFIHGTCDKLDNIFREKFQRTRQGNGKYVSMSETMLEHEYGYEDCMEDINEEIKDIIGDDPNDSIGD